MTTKTKKQRVAHAQRILTVTAAAEKLLKLNKLKEADALLKTALERAPWETPKPPPVPGAKKPTGFGTTPKDDSGMEASSPDPRAKQPTEDPNSREALDKGLSSVLSMAGKIASRIKNIHTELNQEKIEDAAALRKALMEASSLMQKVLSTFGA